MVKRSAFRGAAIGATIAAIAMYVYLNTATIEVKAAEADGVPLWSSYQAPFVIPEAVVGGLGGAIIGLLVGLVRSRLAERTVSR